MRKKRLLRSVSLLLSVLMLISTLSLSAFAAVEEKTYYEENFNESSANAALVTGETLSEVPSVSTVKAEGENKFVRIPFVGAYENAASSASGVETVAGNCDTALRINHAAINDGNGFTVEIDYRPHYNGVANATVEAQFAKYTFSLANGTVRADEGTQLSLFRVNLNDGSLTGCGTVVAGAEGMRLNQWNTLKLTYHPENGKYEIYINGALYARQEKPEMWIGNQKFMNCKDVKIGANQLIVAKCGKNAGGYTATDAGEATNYIDVDNIRVYASREVKVTLDGKETFVNLDVGLDLSVSEKKLLYAEVTPPGKSTFYTTDTVLSVESGTVINTRYVGLDAVKDAHTARAAGGIGLRYLTAVNKADYDGIVKDTRIKSYAFGTVILPADLLAGETLSAEVLKDVKHLDIPVRDGAWYSDRYSVRYCHTFAGSIVDIKEENANRSFIGVGYIRVTMQDGTALTVFAESKKENAASEIMSFTAYQEIMTNPELRAEARPVLEKYMESATKAMEGLNVLAFGDSLFGGTNGYRQSTQWVNKLGLDCGWNLSNLGISGMTVSYTDKNATARKDSMYDWMFNGKNDFRWGSTSKHTSPNPFFHCGEISGDPEDVELIILEGGCNDYGTAIAAPLGTVDSRDSATFLGAWNLITEKLLADYPNATIVFLTTWRLTPQSRENDTLTSIEFSESVITLYEEKYAQNGRVALINAGDPAVSGVDMLNSTWRNEYSTDSYHLKDTGMAVMASNMLPLLWNIIRDRRAGN